MKRLVQIVSIALFVFAMPMQAVTKYKCDFESEAQRARWTLNPAVSQSILNQLKNKWYLGAQGNNDKNGQYGLYISNDNGVSAQYENKACWVLAYDTVRLDYMATDDYLLTFDYTAMGNVASAFDGLYLFWIPMTDPDTGDSIKVLSIPTSDGTIPSQYENYVVQLQPTSGMDYLNGTATWKQCAVNIKGKKCDGQPHYLVFAWANRSGRAQQPGGMVDNINISDSKPCDAPTNLTVTPNGTTVTLTWEGSYTDYEVSAYSYENNSWSGPKIVNGTTTNFTNLPIGQTDFIVRSKCSEDEYSLKTIVSKLIYYPDQMCVDYLNLDNAVCYVHNSAPDNTITFNDFTQVTPVDNGPSNSKSRHVVHFDRNEVENRTGGLAHTVPVGELASVRLGNWEAENNAERIEFSFDVDTIKYPVLLLKYLPILEAPGHEDHENPRFKLDMLINGVSIGRCGMADFNCNDVYANGQLLPGAADQGWHLTPSSVAETSEDVVWKEWTTVGVNLRKPEYEGKKMTVRLTTHDCVFSAHCGYAYFTLGCSDGKLKGMKCGEINPDFMAPDGFAYRWAYAYNERYRNADGSLPEQYVLGRDQEFNAGMHDDSLYVVDCMFVQDSTCFFSLYASTLATNPISVMAEPEIYMNCKDNIYRVSFDASDSWVQEIDHVKGDTLVSKAYHIESYEWTIEGLPYGWSDEVSPTFDFPLEGGDFVVKLRTTCGTCEDILTYNLHLDPLGATHETRTYTLCDDVRKSTGFEWDEKPGSAYKQYGIVDSVELVSPITTCDSIIYLELTEPVRTYLDTMVMVESLPFVFYGREYWENTIDTIPTTAVGCDTTIILNFHTYEPLIVTMPTTNYILCEGDTSFNLVYDIKQGQSLRYSYTFDDATLPSSGIVHQLQKVGHYEIPISIDSTLYPNVYTATLLLVDSLPEFNDTIPFSLTMQYASSIIAQRWNDVLAIKNAEHNGGYTFSAVQWYVSGQPIEGATALNYYTGGNDVTLKFGEEYQALLTRANDGVQLFTCAYVPTPVAADVKDLPSLVEPTAPLLIQGKGMAIWYDLLGRIHSSQSYDHSSITAPSAPGLYLLVLQQGPTRTIHRLMVR